MMTRRTTLWLGAAVATLLATPALVSAKPRELPVLIATDEIPAMEVLAGELATRVAAKSTIVNVKKDAELLPPDLTAFKAVVVYIHGTLTEVNEKALLAYAEGGGNLVLLHHSISSGKRKNTAWFPALGVTVPPGDFAAGGFKYFDDVNWDLVNLAPGHPIFKGVKFPKTVDYNGKKRPAIALEDTEIYLNHSYEGPRTMLLGLRYHEPGLDKLFMQDTAGWVKPHGKGQMTYFMPGHKKTDFALPFYAQMIANAVTYKVKR